MTIHNNNGININILNQDSYLYDLYNQFLENLQFYQLNSSIKSLSIRYYKKNFSLSKNIEDDLDMVSSKRFEGVFDLFDFVPVLESQQFQYQNNNDQNNQGVVRTTSGVITIMCVEEPLPNDFFHLYSNESEIEYLQVTNVTFILSVKKLNIYQLEYTTANLKKSTVDKIPINQHFYFLREVSKFVGSSRYNDFATLLQNREDMLYTINKYYNDRKCCYMDKNLDLINPEINITINKMLSIVSENIYIPKIGPILTVPVSAPYDVKLSFNDSDILLKNELIDTVKKLYDIYFNILNYVVNINDPSLGVQAINGTTVKDYKITSVKDLDGNIISKV